MITVLATPDGRRAIANAKDNEQEARKLLAADPIGRRGIVTWDAEAARQYFTLTS